ncbi:hypothetical protein BDF21DRAFT_427159 [Thamnidium elegans]|uniref:Tc1-like transposase DDE domain-containing protein n=1 Tax=Thamnidium elegans TaxID=101142 RepID=A0A8H7SVJ9_9FUNG|nr:hypothetical protein INT48_004662 [Thamnidium elegans]KAI8066126.1 hypothetical protein BDF21DRAFT_427159 [Thamnidium elegans]
MQSQKVKRCFRNWQGILMEERVANKDVSVDMSRKHVKTQSGLDSFKNWQGIFFNNNVKKCFRNWQGIDLSGMDFKQHDTIKNDLAAQSVVVTPATSKAQVELRRCFKNWQGIYLGFMEFDQVVCLNETRDVGTGPDPSTGFKPNLKSDTIELTYQSLDPFKPSSQSPKHTTSSNQFDTAEVTCLNQIKPLINDLTSIESCQKETKLKKRRYTSDFNTKIPAHVQTSFSTPVKSDNGSTTELLQEQHRQFLIEYVDSHPTAVLNEAFQSFTNKFDGFLVKKSTIQNFIKEQCSIKVLETDAKVKKNNKQMVNSKINVQFRQDWTNAWSQTDIDFTANCVFIECVPLNVVMKSGGLPTKRPELKVTPRFFFVAISTFGIVETQMFHPSVKREDPYVAFIDHVLNQMDKAQELKGSYVVMNGMHDWLLDDLEEIVQDRGYQCVYLPPSAAGLNPITEFWKVVKYGIRRQYLFEGETIADRINESRHHVPKEKVDAFIQYAKLYFDRCLNKPLHH